MKVFFVFCIVVFLGMLNISCSSGNKEMNSEQPDTGKIQILQATKEITADEDTVSFALMQNFTPSTKDTAIGKLFVTGNEPFTRLALRVSQDTVFFVEADSSIKSRLRQMQGKRVGIIGTKKPGLKGISINATSFYTTP